MLLLVCESITKEQISEMESKIKSKYGDDVCKKQIFEMENRIKNKYGDDVWQIYSNVNEILPNGRRVGHRPIDEAKGDINEQYAKLYKICTAFDYRYMPLTVNSNLIDILLFFAEIKGFAELFPVDTKTVHELFKCDIVDRASATGKVLDSIDKFYASQQECREKMLVLINNSEDHKLFVLCNGSYVLNPKSKLWKQNKYFTDFYEKFKYDLVSEDSANNFSMDLLRNLFFAVVENGTVGKNVDSGNRWWGSNINDNLIMYLKGIFGDIFFDNLYTSNWLDKYKTLSCYKNHFSMCTISDNTMKATFYIKLQIFWIVWRNQVILFVCICVFIIIMYCLLNNNDGDEFIYDNGDFLNDEFKYDNKINDGNLLSDKIANDDFVDEDM